MNVRPSHLRRPFQPAFEVNMRKRTLGSRLSFVVPIFLFSAVAGFMVPQIINPAGKAVFGDSWAFASVFVPIIVMGLFFKAVMWLQIARNVEIIPQTPAEFAGVRDTTALLKPASPIPEVPGTGPQIIREDGISGLDFRGLKAATTEFVGLGFTVLTEGEVRTNKTNGPAMFERLLAHPNNSFVEIYQIFPVIGQPLPLSVAMFSFYADDWTLVDATANPNWMTWMWRRDRTLTKRHDFGTGVREMWQSHLERRTRLEAGLSLQALPHTVQDHVEEMHENVNWMRGAIVRRSILVAMIQSKFFRPKDREWWGEFHKFARNGPTVSS